MDRYIKVGKIVGCFGIKGELKIYSDSDFSEYRFRKNASIYLYINNNFEKFTITSTRLHKKNILVTLNNFNNINLVEHYIGFDVYVDKSDQPPLQEEEFYVSDLVGLDVYNQKEEFLGIVSDVLAVPNGSILEVINKNTKSRFLVPFVNAFINEITNDRIVIEEIEGLR